VRLLLQRVTRAEVRRADGPDTGDTVGRIDRGLLAFVGVAPDDGPDEVAWAAAKLLDLRVFPDAAGKMNLDVVAAGGGLLVVSQFTLYGDTRRGRRPGFSSAAAPDVAERVYLDLIERLRRADVPVASGSFGRAMHVELVNDGPVTLWLDSADR
jgi:D-tyrosyl-tRNA(Tyr) deacylase